MAVHFQHPIFRVLLVNGRPRRKMWREPGPDLDPQRLRLRIHVPPSFQPAPKLRWHKPVRRADAGTMQVAVHAALQLAAQAELRHIALRHRPGKESANSQVRKARQQPFRDRIRHLAAVHFLTGNLHQQPVAFQPLLVVVGHVNFRRHNGMLHPHALPDQAVHVGVRSLPQIPGRMIRQLAGSEQDPLWRRLHPPRQFEPVLIHNVEQLAARRGFDQAGNAFQARPELQQRARLGVLEVKSLQQPAPGRQLKRGPLPGAITMELLQAMRREQCILGALIDRHIGEALVQARIADDAAADLPGRLGPEPVNLPVPAAKFE